MMNPDVFRERLAELINSSPKSRSAIAAEFHVAKQTISAWLTGQNSPRLPVVSALAEYFGVSLPWLLGYDSPKYVDKEIERRWDDYIDSFSSFNPSVMSNSEKDLIISFRNLNDEGQQYIKQQINIATQMFNK